MRHLQIPNISSGYFYSSHSSRTLPFLLSINGPAQWMQSGNDIPHQGPTDQFQSRDFQRIKLTVRIISTSVAKLIMVRTDDICRFYVLNHRNFLEKCVSYVLKFCMLTCWVLKYVDWEKYIDLVIQKTRLTFLCYCLVQVQDKEWRKQDDNVIAVLYPDVLKEARYVKRRKSTQHYKCQVFFLVWRDTGVSLKGRISRLPNQTY